MSKPKTEAAPLCEVCGNQRVAYSVGKVQRCEPGLVSFTTAAGTIKTVTACGKCVWRDKHRARI